MRPAPVTTATFPSRPVSSSTAATLRVGAPRAPRAHAPTRRVGRADKVVTVECAYAHSVATTLAAPGGATGPASGGDNKVVTVECAYVHSVATTLAAPGGATGPASGRGQQGGDDRVRLRALCRDH